MIFATFFQMSTGYVKGSAPPIFRDDAKKPIEATGDRATIILDGRHTLQDNIALAKDECAKRGYIGFMLHHGDTLNRSKPITTLQRI